MNQLLVNQLTGADGSKRRFRIHHSYNSEKYAKMVAKFLDKFKQSNYTNLFISCTSLNVNSAVTLKNMFHMGMWYLCDNMDPNGEYKAIKAKFKVHIVKGKGIIFKNLDSPVTIREEPELMSPQAEAWRDELDKFIETAVDNEVKVMRGTAITQGEIDNLRVAFQGIPGFVFSFNYQKIIMAKTDKPLSEEIIRQL